MNGQFSFKLFVIGMNHVAFLVGHITAANWQVGIDLTRLAFLHPGLIDIEVINILWDRFIDGGLA